jgi:beta-phosphoglucomutase-like phosphatase (HAD superfamily)
MIRAAADRLGVPPEQVVVIGDIGSDVSAARAAGSRAVLVPTAATRREEAAAAPVVVGDLDAAVHLSLLEPVGSEREGAW